MLEYLVTYYYSSIIHSYLYENYYFLNISIRANLKSRLTVLYYSCLISQLLYLNINVDIIFSLKVTISTLII